MTGAMQIMHYHLRRTTRCRLHARQAATENGREMYLRLAEAEEVPANQVCEQLLGISEGE